jgi:hypothetical protein
MSYQSEVLADNPGAYLRLSETGWHERERSRLGQQRRHLRQHSDVRRYWADHGRAVRHRHHVHEEQCLQEHES